MEASFSTLLDDEDEFEFEEGEESDFVEDDVDPTLLVENLGLSDEVSSRRGAAPLPVSPAVCFTRLVMLCLQRCC